MQPKRALELVVLGLSAAAVAEAALANANPVGRNGAELQGRQVLVVNIDATTTTTTTATTTSAPASTSSAQPTTTSQTTPTTTTTSTSTSTSSSISSSTESSSSSDLPSAQTTPGSTPASPSSSSSSSPSSTPSTTSKAASTIIRTILTTITTTGTDGVPMTLTSVSVTTQTPDLAGGNNSGQSSGMSPQTRNTVIGVVVGVGGAIILGGLALVAWRIWGRKKHHEENLGLMDYGSTAEKPDTGGSMAGRTPFQSTLESYHAPTQVNTAANF